MKKIAAWGLVAVLGVVLSPVIVAVLLVMAIDATLGSMVIFVRRELWGKEPGGALRALSWGGLLGELRRR